MADDFIDGLRSTSFPIARRGGYAPEAVDSYLRELADWLETGGEDQARAALIQAELARVGERTGAILAAAQAAAEDITAEAREAAAGLRADSEREVAEARAEADAYSSETRANADEHVRISAEAAARESAAMRAEADAAARAKLDEAERLLQKARTEAARRRAGVEQEIAGLVRKRDAIVANLEELASGIRGAVEGPGGQPLEVPEELLAAADAAATNAEEAPREASGDAVAARQPAAAPAVEEVDETETLSEESEEPEAVSEDPAPTRVIAIGEDEETLEDELTEEEDEEDEDIGEPHVSRALPFDTDERELARDREIQRRRSPGSSGEPPTEDQSLTDLL